MGTPAKRYAPDAGQYLADKESDAAKTAALDALEADIGAAEPPKDAARSALEADLGISDEPAPVTHVTTMPVQKIQGYVPDASQYGDVGENMRALARRVTSPAVERTSQGAGYGLGAAQIASQHLADEMAGLGSAAASAMPWNFERRTVDPGLASVPGGNQVASAYAGGRDDWRAAEDKAQDPFAGAPDAFRLGQVTGGVMTAAAPIPGVAKLAPAADAIVRPAFQGLVAGATMGGLNAFGNSRNTGAQLAADTAGGVAVGGTAGALMAAAPAAETALRQYATKKLATKLATKLASASGELENQLGSARLANAAQDMGSAEGTTATLPRGSYGPVTRGQDLRDAALRGADPEAIAQHAEDLTQHVTAIAKPSNQITWEQDIASKTPAIAKMIHESGDDAEAITAAANEQLAAAHKKIVRLLDENPHDSSAMTLRKIQREVFEGLAGKQERAAGEAEAALAESHPTVLSPTEIQYWSKVAKREGRPFEEGVQYVDSRNKAAVKLAREQAAAFEASGEDPRALEAAKALARVDQVKRSLQRVIARNSPAMSGARDILSEHIESPLRNFLEDPKAVGEGPAQFQQIRNRGWTGKLRLEQGAHGRMPFLTTIEGDVTPGTDPYFVQPVGDRRVMQSLVEGAGNPANRQQLAQLPEWADREATLMESLTKHLDPSDPMVADAAAARAHATAIAQKLAQRTSEARAAADLERIRGVKPPEPGAVASLLQSLPAIGHPLKALAERSNFVPSAGQRAETLMRAENTLQLPQSSQAAQDVARSHIADVQRVENMMRRAQAAASGQAPTPVPRALSAESPQQIRAVVLSNRPVDPAQAMQSAVQPGVGGTALALTAQNRQSPRPYAAAEPGSSQAMAALAGRTAGTQAPANAADRQATQSLARGHDIADAAEQAAINDPQVLGKWAGQFQRAKDTGAIGRLLFSLQGNDEFRTTVMPRLQQPTHN